MPGKHAPEVHVPTPSLLAVASPPLTPGGQGRPLTVVVGGLSAACGVRRPRGPGPLTAAAGLPLWAPDAHKASPPGQGLCSAVLAHSFKWGVSQTSVL